MTSNAGRRRTLRNETPPVVICSPDNARRVRKPAFACLPVVKSRDKVLPVSVRSVAVGGERWKRARHPHEQDGRKYVYSLDETAGEIRFGHGIRGRRPSDAGVNVTTTYRYGQEKNDIVLTYTLDKESRLQLNRIATSNVTVQDDDECD